jgi:hypothetical protein
MPHVDKPIDLLCKTLRSMEKDLYDIKTVRNGSYSANGIKDYELEIEEYKKAIKKLS